MDTFQTIPKILYALRLLPANLRGKHRLSRWLIQQFLTSDPADICTQNITFRVPSTREPVAMDLIADGCYEPKLCSVLASILKPDSVFFDVGANVGVMSLSAAHHWCPQGRVIGFEASPKIFSYLDHNALANPNEALRVLNYAVTSRSDQRLTFYDAPSEKFGMGSLVNRFQNTGTEVPTITLDDAARNEGIARVDAIKVDVEGFELGVFQGAQHLLRQNPAPVILFEFNDWAENNGTTQPGDAQRFLLSQGYQLWRLEDYLQKKSPYDAVIEKGGADIIAMKSRFNAA